MSFRMRALVSAVRYQLIVMVVSRTSVGIGGNIRCYGPWGPEALSIAC